MKMTRTVEVKRIGNDEWLARLGCGHTKNYHAHIGTGVLVSCGEHATTMTTIKSEVPKISVIVPNYNHAQHLFCCVSNLCNQTQPPHEIIVVDDGSTDGSVEVLNEMLRGHFPLLRVIKTTWNRGIYLALKAGLDEATGTHVCFTAADDTVFPSLIETAQRLLVNFPSAGLFSGACRWVKKDGTSWNMGGTMPTTEMFVSPDFMAELSSEGRLYIAGQHAVYRMGDMRILMRTFENLPAYEDWAFSNLIGFTHGMAWTPEVLSQFNLSPNTYYNRMTSHSKDMAMRRILDSLDTGYRNIADVIADSAALGTLPVTSQVLRYNRNYLTTGFVRMRMVKNVERICSRLLPRPVFKALARIFYG